MHLAEERQKEVLEQARRIMNKAVPGVLSVSQIDLQLQKDLGMGKTSARRYLYLNIRAGRFIELRPDRFWRVSWPDAESAGIGVVRLCVDMYSIDEKHQTSRLVLSSDHQPGRIRKVGPGGSLYLVTKEHAAVFVNTMKTRLGQTEEKTTA